MSENSLTNVPVATVRGAVPAKAMGHRSAALYWSLFGCAIFVMLMCVLLSLGADMLESGGLTVVAAVAAILPVPIYVGLFLWLDRFEPEPPHLLIGCFTWGAGVAGLFGCVLNSIFNIGLAQVVNEGTAMQLTASISAPLIEETLKGLAVAIIFFWRKADFDGIIDGIIYAGMAALGFAAIENVQYYARGMAGGVGQFGLIFVIRGIFSPYAHVLFTSMTGIGFGLARQSRNMGVKVIAPLIGWRCAMGLHATWNTIPIGGGLVLLLSYLVLWIPIFLGLLTLIFFSLRRESRLIRTHLMLSMEASGLNQRDADEASRLLPRMVGNVPVLFSGGWEGWKRMRRYQRAATLLAFYRQRLASGRVVEDAGLEAMYIKTMVESRGKKA